jgi:hypothetical protein
MTNELLNVEREWVPSYRSGANEGHVRACRPTFRKPALFFYLCGWKRRNPQILDVKFSMNTGRSKNIQINRAAHSHCCRDSRFRQHRTEVGHPRESVSFRSWARHPQGKSQPASDKRHGEAYVISFWHRIKGWRLNSALCPIIQTSILSDILFVYSFS